MALTAGTIAFGTWVLDKIKDKGFDNLYSKLTESNKIDELFRNAVKTVSEKLQVKYPEILGGKIEYFFKTESVFKELIKLIFINSNINLENISNNFDTNTLPPDFILEFITELKNELLTIRDFDSIIADKELFILISGISNETESLAQNSNLALSEIRRIKDLLEERIGNKFLLNDFLIKYSENAVNNLSQVNFIGLGVDISKKINRKNLEDIFVKPYFKVIHNKFIKNHKDYEDEFIFDEESEINYEQLFNYSDKIIILGNPGSGKSILIKSIICEILNKNNADSSHENLINCIPFRIELRKYLAFKKQNRGNIIKYLNSLLEEEYGITSMTETLLEKILKENKNIIFFDGLDEIFKIEDKIDIKNDIENFHNSFPLTKSVTSSRIIGYEEAKLDEEQFFEVNIKNFNDSQIEEYLNKWYEKEEELSERRTNEINGFLQKRNEIDNELISNPLLLSLIVIIYRNTLALPESKLEIYQSCTKTLVEKWDASKKDLEINLDPEIYKKRENILADLAYWQYQELSGDVIKITFTRALNNVASSLERLKITDESEAHNSAENFMAYAQKRSIYFENNFTHKTFLEYYCAYWIYSNIEKKNKTEERNLLISKYIDNSFWHIVLELLINMIDKNQADYEMIDDLIIKQIDKDVKALPFILSTINGYKNVSSDCIKNCINLAIDILINDYNRDNFLNEESLHSKIYESIKKIYSDHTIKKLILQKLSQIEDQNVNLSYLVYALYFEIDYLEINLPQNEIEEYNFDFNLKNKSLFEENINSNKFLFTASCYSTKAKYSRENYVTVIEKFIQNFTINNIYENTNCYFQTDTYYPIIYFYIRNQILPQNIDTLIENLNLLFKLGIKEKELINYVINEHINIRFDSYSSLIDFFDNQEDKTACLFILLVLFSNHLSLNRIKEAAIGKKKEKIFTEIIAIPNKEKKIERILKIYDYSF